MKEPEFNKKINLKAILGIVMSIFWFFMCKDLYPGISLIVYIITIGLDIVLFLICILNLHDEVYEAECPYCNKIIQIDKDAQGLDCPICKERIIIEDYTPKKTNKD